MALNNITAVLFCLIMFLSLLCQSFSACCYISWLGWSPCSNSQCAHKGTRTRRGYEELVSPWHCHHLNCYRSYVQTQQCNGTTPVNCKVSPWSSWSPCSPLQCGKSGFQRRSRTVITNPGCGGTACPSNVNESQICYGAAAVNCTYSAWSKWSECPPYQCGDSQTSRRYIITREQCGGTPCNMTALRKTRPCKQTFCVNQGILFHGKCLCKPGYYGSCCQYNIKYTWIVRVHYGKAISELINSMYTKSVKHLGGFIEYRKRISLSWASSQFFFDIVIRV